MLLKKLNLLFVAAVFSGNVFASNYTQPEKQQQKLDKKCEAAREIKLKPLRDAEIKKCAADKRNDKDECIAFNSTFGDAVHNANGSSTPRMFYYLPECEAAFEFSKNH